MLLDRIDKETTDVTRDEMDMTWWLDDGETITTVVSSSIDLGTTGWSEAPYPPPGAPPPYDPTPLTFNSVAMDPTGTVLIVFVRFGTPGNVYTCQFVLQGSSQRRVTVELGVQITGVPPQQPLPVPVLPPPQGALALSITGGTLQGPLYLYEDPLYPTEAATKAYVDLFLPLVGGSLSGPLLLAGDPTSNLQAATKQYVDAHSGTGGSGGGFVPISGGAMTGFLTLVGDPTSPLVAATKQYVDGVITRGGGPFLPISGGTLTGSLTVSAPYLTLSTGNSDQYLTLTNNAGYNSVIMGAVGSSPRWQLVMPDNEAESGGNAGSNLVINRFSDTGAYLGAPFTINRATGNIAIAQTLSVGGGLAVTGGAYFSNTTQVLNGRVISRGSGNNPGFCAFDLGASAAGGMFQQGAALCFGQMDGNGNAVNVLGSFQGNGSFICNDGLLVNNGRLMSANNGGNPSVTAWDVSGRTAVGFWDTGGNLAFGAMDGGGVPQVEWGTFLANGQLSVLGNITLGGLGSPGMQLAAGGGYATIFFNNWALQFQAANGNLVWERYDNVVLFYCDANGSLHTHVDIDAGSNVNAANAVVAQAGVYAVGGNMGMFSGGDGRIIQFNPNYYFDWNISTGDLYWTISGTLIFEFRVSDGNSGNNRGSMYGFGAYINLSDERAKTNVQPSTYGLPEILQLNPIAFERTNVVSVRREHGFSAQQVRPVIPEAVVAVTQNADPLLGVTLDPIVAALVNGMKEMHARLLALEVSMPPLR